MSVIGSYPVSAFSPTQYFLIYNPSTQTTERVLGSDLVTYVTAGTGYVRSVSTRAVAQTLDLEIGIILQTGGGMVPADGGSGAFLVVAAGEGDYAMNNGNELLVLPRGSLVGSDLDGGLVTDGGVQTAIETAIARRGVVVASVAALYGSDWSQYDYLETQAFTAGGSVGRGQWYKSGIGGVQTTDFVTDILANGYITDAGLNHWYPRFEGSVRAECFGFSSANTGSTNFLALKAAFYYASTITPSKKSVFVPAGQYTVSPTEPITVYSGFKSCGEQFTQFTTGQDAIATRIIRDTDVVLFKAGNSTDSFYSPASSSTIYHSIVFEDMSIATSLSSGDAPTTPICELWNVSEPRMKNMQWKNAGHACVIGEDVWDGRFNDSLFDGGEPDGWASLELRNGNNNSNACAIMGCRFETSTGPMLSLSGFGHKIGGGTKIHGDCNQGNSNRYVVSNAADNGSGLIRLTIKSTGADNLQDEDHGLSTNDYVRVSRVGGTTEANALYQVTVIDGRTVDLQGSTFSNTYTSGGIVVGVLPITGAAAGATSGVKTRIRITSAGHGLSSLDTVMIGDTGGTTEADGHWQINVIDADNFDLYGSNFVNTYTSGGFIYVTTVSAISIPNGTIIDDVTVENFDATDVNKTKALIEITGNNGNIAKGIMFYQNENDSGLPDAPHILTRGSNTSSGSNLIGPNNYQNQPNIIVHNRATGSSSEVSVYWPDAQGLRNDNISNGKNAFQFGNKGSWTPAITCATNPGDLAVTYDSATGGLWSLNGKTLTLQGYIRTDAITVGTAAGAVSIDFSSLPDFVAIATSSNAGWTSGSVYSSAFGGDHPSHAIIQDGTQLMGLYYRATANGASAALQVSDLGTGANANILNFSIDLEIE